MVTPQALTELESCTLGVIRQHQPCSTYQVRGVFARSSTTAWSASAGSIYPVIERLIRTGHIRSSRRSRDGRGRRDLMLTREGERALQSWILSLEQWAARATPDPIRTRVCFLDYVVSRPDRLEFLALAQTLTRTLANELRVEEQSPDITRETDRLVSLGCRMQLEARLKWLAIVRRRLAARPRRRSS